MHGPWLTLMYKAKQYITYNNERHMRHLFNKANTFCICFGASVPVMEDSHGTVLLTALCGIAFNVNPVIVEHDRLTPKVLRPMRHRKSMTAESMENPETQRIHQSSSLYCHLLEKSDTGGVFKCESHLEENA